MYTKVQKYKNTEKHKERGGQHHGSNGSSRTARDTWQTAGRSAEQAKQADKRGVLFLQSSAICCNVLSHNVILCYKSSSDQARAARHLDRPRHAGQQERKQTPRPPFPVARPVSFWPAPLATPFYQSMSKLRAF